MSDRLTERQNIALEERDRRLGEGRSLLPETRKETLEERDIRMSALPVSQRHNESFINEKNNEFDNLINNIKGSLEADNSEAVANTLALVDFFSQSYNTDKMTVFNHLDSYIDDYYGEKTPHKTALKAITDEFVRARKNNGIASLTSYLMVTEDEALRRQLEQQIAWLEESMPPEDVQARGILTSFLKPASSIVGSMVDFVVTSAVTSAFTGGRGSAAAFAQLIPNLQRAQKIAAIGLYNLPRTAATFNTSLRIESGAVANEMRQLGIDDEIIKQAYRKYTTYGAALETLSVELIFSTVPGLKQLAQQSFLKVLLKDKIKYDLQKGIAQLAPYTK